MFSLHSGRQYFIHPRGRDDECLTLSEGLSCELLVEPCATGYHRRELWLVDMEASTTTLKNRKTGQCLVPHSMQIGAGLGEQSCDSATQGFEVMRAD